LTQKFPSNTSLWEVLRQFESGEGRNYNFTQRGVPEINSAGGSGAGRLNYEMPVITVMPGHREQSDFVGLQQTLSQLGFDSGSALLKLSFKNSGTPLEEAMSQITQYFKNSEASAKPSSAGEQTASSVQGSPVPNPSKVTPEATQKVTEESIKTDEADPEPMEVDSRPTEVSPVTPTVDTPIEPDNTQPEPPVQTPEPSSAPAQSRSIGQKVQVFAASTSATPQAARNGFNESDYVPTIEHAKSHQAALQSRTRNQRLLSDKELEEQEAARQEKIQAVAEKGSSVRVRLPDGAMVQTSVGKEDTAEGLYDFVQGLLQHKEPFQLKNVGSNGRLVLIPRDKKRLIQDLRFSSSELITFLWDDNASVDARTSRKILAKEWQDKAQTLRVEEPAPTDDKKVPVKTESKAEGKRKAGMSASEKENKLKSMFSKTLFKR
jgi:tether containing UBX domain for GLUT4